MIDPAEGPIIDADVDAPTRPHRTTASIGILTYRRPRSLARCLDGVLAALNEESDLTWSIAEVLVVDNDPAGSARSTVLGAARKADTAAPVRYVHEPLPGVANARNRALSEARGDVLVFIDDDEIPASSWPTGLLAVLHETGAAMVGGPVHTEFTSPPPRWVTEGRFFERDEPPHLSLQTWLRSGNLAIDLDQVKAAGIRFDPRYRQGEDSAFTRTARAAGLQLRWSSNGAITEFVDAERFSPRWRWRREYVSHRAWTRSSLDIAAGSPDRVVARGRAALVALVRAAQGGSQVIVGLSTANAARRIEGLANLAGAAGRMVEIVAYRRP